jgi:hypothetical protein
MRHPTRDEIIDMATTHLRRYGFRYEQARNGVQGYSLDAGNYLRLWVGIKTADYQWDKMTHAEQNEVMDTFGDE